MKLLLSAALLLVPPVAANATDTPWRPLFNGRDLTGWKIVGAQPRAGGRSSTESPAAAVDRFIQLTVFPRDLLQCPPPA
jgi:hypothetical protein